MELDYKVILGAITILMTFYGYMYYIIDIVQGKTKPHLFSWIIFSILGVFSFLIQYNAGAGPGAWGVGAATLITLMIAVLAFKFGEKEITQSDTLSFIGSLLVLVLYVLMDDPRYSLVLIMIVIGLAFFPTFRKSWNKPKEETVITYVLAGIRHIIGLFAIYYFSFLTFGLPIFLVLINISLVTLIVMRKKKLGIK